MLDSKRFLVIIPARAGSKGIPKKNIKELGSLPLIAWSIIEAKKSKYVDRVILSSDSSEIAEIAIKYGCEVPFIRPEEISTDQSPSIDFVIHALDNLNEIFDYVVLLQPTSPFRTVNDIDESIETIVRLNSESLVSVCESPLSPYSMYELNDEGKLKPLMGQHRYTRRQDFPKVYITNGAIYINSVKFLRDNLKFVDSNTFSFIMDSEKSIDLDTEFDWIQAETQLKRLKYD